VTDLAQGERRARLALGTLVLALVALALSIDLPALTGRVFFNDGATYYTMAWSLAEDFDLRFEPADLARVRKEYPDGPDGIFLKRPGETFLLEARGGLPRIRHVAAGERDRPIFFGKPFLYPLAVAPLVKVFGTRGILLGNALCLGLALALAYRILRKQAGPGKAFFSALVLILGTVAPLYVLWPTPEIFYLALASAGLAAWSDGRPRLSAILLGLLTYAKPPSIFLAAPLCLEPLFRKDLREGIRRGVLLVATMASLFVANRLMTGEWNYQSGERKTFYTHFPGESPKVTFGNSGFWMTAEHIGPTTEGTSVRGQVVRAKSEVRAAFLLNLGYFLVGRFAGVVPYYFPLALGALLFVLVGPRSAEGGLALFCLVLTSLFWIWYIPDNWYGGGGTVGNRYLTSLLPIGVFLIPRGREALFIVLSAIGGGLFVGPLFRDPLTHALRPGIHATKPPFTLLPAELTMLNDLSIFTELWRKKVPYGDTLGRHGEPADPASYWLYFVDDGTTGKARAYGVEGFWLRPGAEAEVILRALEPVGLVRVRVYPGPGGDRVQVRLGKRAPTTLYVGEGEIRAVTLDPGAPYVFYDSFVYTLRLRSDLSGKSPPGEPERGGFIQLSLDPRKRAGTTD
jgi:hypothetical protein